MIVRCQTKLTKTFATLLIDNELLLLYSFSEVVSFTDLAKFDFSAAS